MHGDVLCTEGTYWVTFTNLFIDSIVVIIYTLTLVKPLNVISIPFCAWPIAIMFCGSARRLYVWNYTLFCSVNNFPGKWRKTRRVFESAGISLWHSTTISSENDFFSRTSSGKWKRQKLAESWKWYHYICLKRQMWTFLWHMRKTIRRSL